MTAAVLLVLLVVALSVTGYRQGWRNPLEVAERLAEQRTFVAVFVVAVFVCLIAVSTALGVIAHTADHALDVRDNSAARTDRLLVENKQLQAKLDAVQGQSVNNGAQLSALHDQVVVLQGQLQAAHIAPIIIRERAPTTTQPKRRPTTTTTEPHPTTTAPPTTTCRIVTPAGCIR